MNEMNELRKKLNHILQITKELDKEVDDLKYLTLMVTISNDDERNEAWLLQDKMNAIRSYIHYQSVNVADRRTRIQEEIKFYDHFHK